MCLPEEKYIICFACILAGILPPRYAQRSSIHVRFTLRPEDSIHEVSHLMLEQDELLAPGRGFGCRMICLGLCLWKSLVFFEVP